jgi:hypothetical protein
MIAHLLILAFLVGCSTSKPTPYQKVKNKEGYRDHIFEELKVATFGGNEYTKKDRAQLYAQFRAIEKCRQNNKYANMIDIFDKTVEKNVIRSYGTGWSPTYFGTYPYYSRYSSFGMSAGYSSMSYNSWSETLSYPVIEVYYNCNDSVVRPQMIFKEITADNMKHLVKDVKGAIQVEKLLDHSPNKGSIEVGDIVLKANGRRLEKVYQLISLFNKDTIEVSVQLLRDGKTIIEKLKSVDITVEVKKTEEELIASVCKHQTNDNETELKTNPLCPKVRTEE